MKTKLCLISLNCLLLMCLFPGLARGEKGIQVWAHRYNSPNTNADQLVALVVDHDNNVIVSGNSTVAAPSAYAFATVKYSSGGVPLWTNRYNSPGPVQSGIPALAVDHSNNIVLATLKGSVKYSSSGQELWTNDFASIGIVGAMSVDGNDDVILVGSWPSSSGVTIRKYSNAGSVIWSNSPFSSGSSVGPYAVAVDSSNSVIVVSHVTGYTTMKYSSSGLPLWTNSFVGDLASTTIPFAVAVDANNDVIVSGKAVYLQGGATFTTVKYSESGVPIWTNRPFGGASFGSQVSGLAIDGNNDVIVTGYSISDNAIATVKISGTGVTLWTNFVGKADFQSGSKSAVAVDSGNNVVVGAYLVTPPGYTNFATIKYTSAGIPLWTNLYNGVGDPSNLATTVAVDSDDNIVVAGNSRGIGTGIDFATVKYVCVPEPQVSNFQKSGETFEMLVEKVMPTGRLIIQASSNCVDWIPVFTNTTATNSLLFADPESVGMALRFYRVIQSP